MGSAQDPKVTFVISMVLQLKAHKVTGQLYCSPWNIFTAQGSTKMQNALWSDNDMQAFQGISLLRSVLEDYLREAQQDSTPKLLSY